MTGDFLSIEVLGERNLLRNVDQMPETVLHILRAKTAMWLEKLESAVVASIERNLKTKTGKLAAGVKSILYDDGMLVGGSVYIAGVPYARIQDQGGVTPPHIIRARNSKVMAFYAATGNKVFATRVMHPGGVIAPTYFMKEAYREVSPDVGKGIKKAIVEGIRQNMRKS